METSNYSPKPEIKNDAGAPKEPSKALKIGVLVILIVLLIIGIILPIKLVPDAFSSISTTISSWFGSTKTTLSTNPSMIQSGSPFTLSWTGDHKDTGSYSISYSCAEGVSLEMSFGGSPVTIPCGSAYYFSSTANSISLTPVSSIERYTDITLTLGYLEAASSSPETLGTLLISIENQNASGTSAIASTTQTTTGTTPVQTATTTTTVTVPPPTTVPPPVTTTTTTTKTPPPVKTTAPAPVSVTRAHRVSNPYGTTDLSVKIVATGYMTDGAAFVPASSISSSMRAAFEFVVTNVGDKSSGPWSFTATLPTVYHPTYSAYNLPNLGPGDSIEYFLAFDSINPGYSNPVSITVTSPGEAITADNSATATIIQY
jgi:hypothetical protein